nr:hypothetical protein [Tanacetum cinerariifolium]
MLPYPRFAKIIVSHYMTTFPEIWRRASDRYHNMQDDVMIKSIFKLRKSKNVVGMQIPDWMITDEMKLRENYRKFNELAKHLEDIMMEALPKLVDDCIKVLLKKQVPLNVAEGLILEREKSQADVAKLIADAIQQERENLRLVVSSQINDVIANHIPSQDDPHDDAQPEREKSAKRKKISEHETFELGGSSSGQDYESKPGPSTLVSQELVNEILQTVDEAKLRKTSKNSHEKIFHIKNQQALGKPKEEIYSNSKIVQIIKTYWELGHEHKFITEIIARRENESIMFITESDYKNLNKNDIKDIYLERVYDFQLGVESYQKQVNLTAPKITIPSIKEYEVFSIVSEPVYGIIYEYNNKEKRVMRHHEVHKFCDATLKRVLEGLKSYNNDVKYGYVTHNLSKENIEYLQLFFEENEEQLKYQDQMRRWEMYVNGRQLRPRRECP